MVEKLNATAVTAIHKYIQSIYFINLQTSWFWNVYLIVQNLVYIAPSECQDAEQSSSYKRIVHFSQVTILVSF